MTEQLNKIMLEEYKSLQALLGALDEQFQHLTKREVFALDRIIQKIEGCTRDVARLEVARRKITNGESMSKIVRELNNEELEKDYRNIKKLLEEIQVQKNTNEILIKQNLGFTTQMLNFLNPDRGSKIYNSYGKRR